MSKYICKISVMFLVLTMAFVSTVNVSASEKKDDVSVIEAGDKRIVTDNTLKESVIIVFDDESKTKGTIQFPDKTVSRFEQDEQGSLYLDGQLVFKCIKTIDNQNNTMTRATTWIQGVTKYYEAGVYQNAQNASWFLLSLFPYIGTFAMVHEALSYFQDARINVAYVKVEQFLSSDYRQYKNIVYYYRYSNYTGLVKSYTTIGRTPV